MKKTICLLSFALAAVSAPASWYWPFGSDDDDIERNRPRLSALMEPASVLIDEASDLAEDGKITEAVEKYREALGKLDLIEAENRDLVQKPEFATLRNKRAYVNASIDSLLLAQVKANARAVAVSDTTKLEQRLAEERRAKAGKPAAEAAKPEETKPEKKEPEAKKAEEKKPEAKKTAEAKAEPKKAAAPKKPVSRRAQAMADLASGDYNSAALIINEMLALKPDDPAALNLQAVMHAQQGDYKQAEKSLDRAISVHPRNHYAYYNMANLILQFRPANRDGARRYYQTGRDVGGPRDAKLEERLK